MRKKKNPMRKLMPVIMDNLETIQHKNKIKTKKEQNDEIIASINRSISILNDDLEYYKKREVYWAKKRKQMGLYELSIH